jgi:hypothetical protein
MTDQGQPLSRRDRRAMEQQAEGQVAGTETGEIPTHGPDGTPLSRRDRRRLERSENPMEIWTAEEEQIATGQMPAMTPEVIAEQEALAREKARVAAEEARAASAELRGVAASSVDSGRIDEIEGRARGTLGSAAGLPMETSPSEIPDWMSDIAAAAERGGADSRGIPTVSQPFDASGPEPAVQEPDSSQIPEALRHMFPPGSLQARAMSAHDEASTPSDQGADEAPVGSSDPADEIRRLTAAAMANIDGSGRVVDDVVPAPNEDESAPGASSPYDMPLQTGQPELDRYAGQFGQEAASSQEQPQVPSFEMQEPESGDNRQAPGAFAGFGLGASSADDPAAFPPFGQVAPEPQQHNFEGTPPLAPELEAQPFEQIIASGEPAQQPLLEPEPSGGQQWQDSQEQWNEHPLSAAQPSLTGAHDFEPIADIPQPDLSQVSYPATPGVGIPGALAPESGQFPVTTGSIEIQRRAIPELEPAGGAQHFRWAHLLVIGAIAFALGVAVWHIAGVGQ